MDFSWGRGDYKLWSDIGRDHSPDWNAAVAALKHTDLDLFDLSKDVAEKNDLRTEFPDVYASLKTELIDHFANINTEHPSAEKSEDSHKENLDSKKTAPTPAPKRRSQEQFFKNRDRNGDGAITLEEFIGNPKDRDVPALTKRFRKIDSNGDGKLQMNELKKQTK